MIGGQAVEGDMRAGGIIGDHAAQSGARTGGHVRPETKTVRFEKVVELVQDHAGADANGAAFKVQRGDLAVVPREINHHARADRAAGQSRARPARDDLQPRVRRGADDGGGLRNIAREGDSDRLDLVERGVGRVKLPCEIVEGDITISGGKSGDLLGRSHARIPCLQPIGVIAG